MNEKRPTLVPTASKLLYWPLLKPPAGRLAQNLPPYAGSGERLVAQPPLKRGEASIKQSPGCQGKWLPQPLGKGNRVKTYRALRKGLCITSSETALGA